MTIAPTFNISNHIQVGTAVIINQTIGSNATNNSLLNSSVTYSFVKAFTSAPQIGVGIYQLEGNYKFI
jgi:hypothetical protein